MNPANAIVTGSATTLVTSSSNLPSADGATTVNNNTITAAITTVSTNDTTNDASPTGSDATTLHGADDTPIVNNNTATAAISTVSTNDTTNVAIKFIGKRVAKKFLNDEGVEEVFRGTATKTSLIDDRIHFFILYDDADFEDVDLKDLSFMMDMYRRVGEKKCFYLSKVDGKYKEICNVRKEEILDYVSSELKRPLFQIENTIVEKRFEQLIMGTCK